MTEKDEYIIKITKEERDEILTGLQNNLVDYLILGDQHTSVSKVMINTNIRRKIDRAEKTMEF